MARNADKESRRGNGGGGDGLLFLVTVIIGIIAVRRQLRMPTEDRTWHGTVDVPVPYEFRLPSAERMTRSVWAPDDSRLFVPMAWGVGWSVNVARLLRRGAGTAA
jgi:hypothetical protein